ncbi:MAG TPA: DUF305 domain-containing protein [Gemmatimonadales bacterium]|jgi:uncharacterized protein (DUF305 family)|nr:DUF305 domain-containing protein [Gemmatimonadales bacterium]
MKSILAVVVLAACATSTPSVRTAAPAPAAAAPARRAPPPATAADIHFFSGMIRHHAQAVLMAGWAPSHGASASLRALCERIVVGQRDEIALASRWLRARNEPVPETDASHDMMPGMDHMLMPGMLTPEQLGQLDRARGTEFDRLFLTFMIQHHQGAITMVNDLFSAGGGEEDVAYKFASDIFADQTTEIDRMQKMLAAQLFQGRE